MRTRWWWTKLETPTYYVLVNLLLIDNNVDNGNKIESQKRRVLVRGSFVEKEVSPGSVWPSSLLLSQPYNFIRTSVSTIRSDKLDCPTSPKIVSHTLSNIASQRQCAPKECTCRRMMTLCFGGRPYRYL